LLVSARLLEERKEKFDRIWKNDIWRRYSKIGKWSCASGICEGFLTSSVTSVGFCYNTFLELSELWNNIMKVAFEYRCKHHVTRVVTLSHFVNPGQDK
jgi:hypothetical protein